MAELRETYERSLAKLRPIKENLCLIDQIVYRLYGLTEEEISQVKGKSESADDDKREVAGT